MMYYHPHTQTIVPEFNGHLYPPHELLPLVVVAPAMQEGDTMIARTPVPHGDYYVLEYDVLAAGGPEQTAYFEGL